MNFVLPALQIVISLVLIIFILLQEKGGGLGSAWGGSGEFYRSRRGVEKILFYATIIIASLFLISSVVGVVVNP
ncbi:preprotein translocase subunit SecG [Candidatus Microgenomates bacterium]|nr:preprotein translocase subunit SecG [Candidatus Microgenomates bacterium]